MGKIVVLIHLSLDGFLSGLNGEINWIKIDDEIFEYTNKLCFSSSTAIFGKNTYKMMETYWPTAGDKKNASDHDKKHSKWLNNALKVVFSKNLQNTEWNNSQILNKINKNEISKIIQQSPKDLIIIGSASIIQSFLEQNFIDSFFINVSPVILGKGIPLFQGLDQPKNLQLMNVTPFQNGVVGLHYDVIKAFEKK